MRYLVTGSSGHLGEALLRTLRASGHDAVGVDVLASEFTTLVGSIADRDTVRRAMAGVEAVIHTATLHKPHVATHDRQSFVDTNVSGTLHCLEEAVRNDVRAFVFTSTTSVFGDALSPPESEPAAWVTEETEPIPKNIYGVTKAAAEALCQLFHRNHRLPCVVLRTSRFFPEDDDVAQIASDYDSDNAKVNEFLYRRVDIDDVVKAHLLAVERSRDIGFDRFIISATSPFESSDLDGLRSNAPEVVRRRVPEYVQAYERLGWRMFPSIDRVYVNERARRVLGWAPQYDFRTVLARVGSGQAPRSPLAESIGAKGYHPREPLPIRPAS